jgi:hypothetical protein
VVDAKLRFHFLFVFWAWIPTIASEFHFVNLCACFYVCDFVVIVLGVNLVAHNTCALLDNHNKVFNQARSFFG